MAVITLPDGRLLAYEVGGDPAGDPVVALHGTPGSARQLSGLHEVARGRRCALVTPDRAGYGQSTFDRARTIASSARDIGHLLDHLGIERCAVVGFSGGGPSALACGRLLADRVSVVVTVGSVAPLVPRPAIVPPDRLLTRVARRSERAVRLLFAVMIGMGRRRPERTLDRFAAMLAEPDARLLRADGPVRAGFLDDMRHPSDTAAAAAARDFWLFAHRWDVDLAAMGTPVHVWHGTQDKNVPVAHARVIAEQCPSARLHLVEGGGHMPLDRADQIFDDLRAP